MLVNDTEQFLKTNFENEAEIERVVQQYAQQLFGGSIIYLPQARLSTVAGRGSIPDALVIDVEREEWFVVEAERAAHGTWEHIAPQVSSPRRVIIWVWSTRSVKRIVRRPASARTSTFAVSGAAMKSRMAVRPTSFG